MGFHIFKTLHSANKCGYADRALLTSRSRFNPIFPLTSTRKGADHTARGARPQRDKCLKSILVLPVPCRTLQSRAGLGACPQPWCCPPGGTEAGLEPSTLSGRPVPAAAASNELTGPSSPLAERGGGRTRSAGPSLHGGPIRPRIRQDPGGFVASRTGRDLFVPQCRFLLPFRYFRFLPTPQEPNEPAAPCGAGSRGRRCSALPAAVRTLLLGAVPEHPFS